MNFNNVFDRENQPDWVHAMETLKKHEEHIADLRERNVRVQGDNHAITSKLNEKISELLDYSKVKSK